VSVAPWRSKFLTQIAQLDSPEFVLSTVAPSSDPASPIPYEPRARYCVYRGMFGELPENKHNIAPKNDRVYESELLTFTTDVRMAKIPELFGTGTESRDGAQHQGSGGGGKVEAVFWVKSTMTQWRFKGTAFVIAPDIEGKGEESSGARIVKSAVGSRMRAIKEEGKDSWSWATELTAQFANLSPGMRGSFKNPVPGISLAVRPAEKGLALGQHVTDNNDELARRNFRVVVIRPDVVELLDLSDMDKGRRWKFTYVGSGGEKPGQKTSTGEDWTTEELWP
jgi:pyridoxamine 5'-phosphate oxidase